MIFMVISMMISLMTEHRILYLSQMMMMMIKLITVIMRMMVNIYIGVKTFQTAWLGQNKQATLQDWFSQVLKINQLVSSAGENDQLVPSDVRKWVFSCFHFAGATTIAASWLWRGRGKSWIVFVVVVNLSFFLYLILDYFEHWVQNFEKWVQIYIMHQY